MGFLKKLSALLAGPKSGTTTMQSYYIQCDRCSTKFKIGVNMSSELVNTYQNKPAFTCHKTAQDDKCFSPIEIDLSFDMHRREMDKTIKGGPFLSKEEYEQSD